MEEGLGGGGSQLSQWVEPEWTQTITKTLKSRWVGISKPKYSPSRRPSSTLLDSIFPQVQYTENYAGLSQAGLTCTQLHFSQLAGPPPPLGELFTPTEGIPDSWPAPPGEAAQADGGRRRGPVQRGAAAAGAGLGADLRGVPDRGACGPGGPEHAALQQVCGGRGRRDHGGTTCEVGSASVDHGEATSGS